MKGAHQIGFGVNNIHSRLNAVGWTDSDGVFSFTAQNTGIGLGDFMLGDVNNYLQGGGPAYRLCQRLHRGYVQDTWKINSRLTLNGGSAMGSLSALFVGRR